MGVYGVYRVSDRGVGRRSGERHRMPERTPHQ